MLDESYFPLVRLSLSFRDSVLVLIALMESTVAKGGMPLCQIQKMRFISPFRFARADTRKVIVEMVSQ
jgi:hypothetical protein